MFLSVQTNCFDEINVFDPKDFVASGLHVVFLLHLTKNVQNMFLSVEINTNCFIEK
jgi:hypothetical protein